jgi:peptidoglycan/LPS O-acetylase OafA/YrhL
MNDFPNIKGRNQRFDTIRLFAALLVLWSHAFPIAGRRNQEPLARLTGLDELGGLGVAIFFTLSGYLLTVSLERHPSLLRFVINRCLRIYPALVVMCLIVVFIFGPAITNLPRSVYISHDQTIGYLITSSALRIEYSLPGVFTNNPLPNVVNGSLWSLPYEVQCYGALIALTLLPLSPRWKATIIMVTLAVVFINRPRDIGLFDKFAGLDYYHLKLGWFFFGGCFLATWRKQIYRHRLLLLGLSAAWLTWLSRGTPMQWLSLWAATTCLTIWIARDTTWIPAWPDKLGDWSYGVYLYGFPIQQIAAGLKLHDTSFTAYMVLCTIITLMCGAASWHAVEKRALRYRS